MQMPIRIPAPNAAPNALGRSGARRVADQIVQVLYEAGVRAIFGVPGGAISAIYDALLDEPRICVVNTSHESAAVFSAIGYARATGRVGVVLTTSGPGVTNAITGIASAHLDSVPVLLLGGEVPRKNFGRGALQEGSPYQLNLVSMLRSITKASSEVTSPDSAVSAVHKAIATALSGRRGPVFLSLPLDMQGASTTVPRMAVNVESHFTVERELINAALQRILTAERPLVLAGSGVRWGQGPSALLRFAEAFRIPVATTPKAKGVFPESHPLSLGIYGHGGHPSSEAYLEEGLDVLVAVGTSFGDAATNSWTERLRPSRSFIHVDIDSSQIGKNYAADLGIAGPAETVLATMADLAPRVRPIPIPGGRRFFHSPEASDGVRLKPQRALWELQQILPRSTAYCCDIGEHMMFALHYLTIDEPDAFYLSSGLAAMGSSLGMATGVKMAAPDRPVVAVCGDGTMSMAALELATAARLGMNVVYLVLNDLRYAMVEEGHRSIYGRTPAFPVTADLGQLAVALGGRATKIEHPGELLELGGKWLLEHPGPVLLDVRIDPTEAMPKRSRFDSLQNFVGRTKPAEA